MGDKNGRTQRIDKTQGFSWPFPHMCLTIINMVELDEIRLSQLIFVTTEGSEGRFEQNILESLRENINVVSLLL